MMSTGDMTNNLRKLQNELKLIQYINKIEFEKMLMGLPAPFLPILHHVFTEYSYDLSAFFSAKGYDLCAKNDVRFLEVIYKILIQEFGTKPMLTKQQFFSIGYSEMKVIFITKIISLCREKLESVQKTTIKKKKKNSTSRKINNYLVKLGVEEAKPKTNNQSEYISNHVDSEISNNLESTSNQMIDDPNLRMSPPEAFPSDQPINPPTPNPDLASSPVKSHGESVLQNFEDEIKEIDSMGLDLTDIAQESFVETGSVELIDVSDKKGSTLPEFMITKHSSAGRNVKLKENNWPISVNGSTEDHCDLPAISSSKTQLTSEYSLPSDVSFASSMATSQYSYSLYSQQSQQCQQSITNSNIIKDLLSKIELMEKNVRSLVDIIDDLSAKVVLLETRVKIMGNRAAEIHKCEIDPIENPDDTDRLYHYEYKETRDKDMYVDEDVRRRVLLSNMVKVVRGRQKSSGVDRDHLWSSKGARGRQRSPGT